MSHKPMLAYGYGHSLQQAFFNCKGLSLVRPTKPLCMMHVER